MPLPVLVRPPSGEPCAVRKDLVDGDAVALRVDDGPAALMLAVIAVALFEPMMGPRLAAACNVPPLKLTVAG